MDADTPMPQGPRPVEHLFTGVEMRGTGVVASAVHVSRMDDGQVLIGITCYSPGGPFNTALDLAQIKRLHETLGKILEA